MNRDFGVWTYKNSALVLIEYFAEVTKLGVSVGVSEAEKQAVRARERA